AAENAAAERLRNSRTAVVHADADVRVALFEADLHRAPIGRELRGIGEEVGHDLKQPLAVGVHFPPRQLAARLEAYLEALAEALVEHDRLAHQAVDRQYFGRHADGAGLDLLDVENVVDDVEQALSVALGDQGQLAHVSRQLAGPARIDQLHGAA